MKKHFIIVFCCTLTMMLQAQDIYIYNNTTWTTNQTINGNVFIWNNAELTIAPGVTVDFTGATNNMLIIRPDAKLTANQATFTSSTGRWHGITMDGLGSQYPQAGTPAQPKAVLIDCHIRNTQIAISNYHLNPYTATGGWIMLSGCEITDFTIAGVWLSNYRYINGSGNIINDKSRVVKSIFEPGNVGANGIYMYKVNNIQILGNEFRRLTYPCQLFTGIRIVLSSATIKPFGLQRNEFYECWKGIYISNGFNPSYKVVIENNLFDNSMAPQGERVAIQAIAANNLTIISNEIKLRMSCNGQPPNPCWPNQFGIHLNGCTGFHVENNHISVNPNKGPLYNTYGIVVVNSGGQSNEIYRNTIEGCHYAIQALNKNRGIEHPTQPNDDGLRFFCNTLRDNKTSDYYALSAEVEPAHLTDPIYGVAKMQGGSMVGIPTSPTFNVIEERLYPLPVGSENDFYNNHQSPTSANLSDVVYMEPKVQQGVPWYYIVYYTGNQNNFGIPNHVSPVPHPQITADPIAFPRCESRLPGVFPGINEIVDNIQNAYNDFQIAMDAFTVYANDGDHNYMLTVANGIDSSNYIFAYFDFMTKNPSHDVLAIMAANESMPASYVADILLQNTYGIKDGHVREALANRADSLSQASLDTIFQAANGLSQYETYKMDVGYYSNQLRKLKNLQHNYYLSADTSLVDLNGIIAYLDADDDFQSKFSLLMHYYYQMDQGNVDIYKDALEQSTSDSYEIEDYHQLSEILDIIYFNYNGDYTQLSPSEIAMLEDLVPGTTVASGIALSLLEGYLGYQFPLSAADLTSQTPRMGRFPDEPGIIEHIVYPNPAGSTVTVSLIGKVEGAQVIILDMAGRTVLSAPLSNASTTLDVSRLGNGIYIIRILGTNKPIGTEKLIINK
jgi:hypothetical protein